MPDTTSACLAEPPTDGPWGDCWCTLPTGHSGEHRCEPCTARSHAPGWSDAPDWADVREAARNAGWTRRGGIHWGIWSVRTDADDFNDAPGWVVLHMPERRVEIIGPGEGPRWSRSVAELKNPTPAQVLTIARELGLVGLGGGDER